jgi:PPOX class probable F420-dependent enzyme
MPTAPDDTARRLLDGKSFATVATLQADGSPQTSVVWIKRDGDHVLFSTVEARQKARNLRRDPRVSVSLFDPANPYLSIEIRGRAALEVDEHKALPVELSQKYLGQDPPAEKDDEVRLIVRITPEKVITFSP